MAVYGNFSAPKVQEVVVAKGNVLELLRPDDTGRMQPVCSVPVFGQLRSLQKFRMAGDPFDHVVVGSDSGRLVVLRFDKDRGVFRKVHQETFGKTGCRRIVPGQFVATDPRGRAIMVGALEKQKFTYVMNRDTDGNMTISSPLEAHKTSHLCFDLVGLDCGYDNPVFAAIEIDYSEVDDDPTGQAAMQARGRGGIRGRAGCRAKHAGQTSRPQCLHRLAATDRPLARVRRRKRCLRTTSWTWA